MIAGGFPQLPEPTGYTEWGYIGALVFLVIAFGVFLIRMDTSNKAYHDKRDNEWREFFRGLAKVSETRLDSMTQVTDKITHDLEKLIEYYQGHDGQAKEIKTLLIELRKDVERLCASPTTARKGPTK